MARIAGVNIPTDKRVIVSITYIYGVGDSIAKKILSELSIDENIRVKDMSEDQLNKVREAVEKRFTVEGELRRERMQNIKRLKEIGSYRGLRHMRSLPVRGQRTRTNSRTVRGNVRKTMGSGRRIMTKT